MSYQKTHSVTVIAAAAIGRYRFVGFDGAHANSAGGVHDAQGISEAAAGVGEAVSLVTGYSSPVEAAEPIAKGDFVRPAADGTGRAAKGTQGDNCGRALTSAVLAGALCVVRFGEPGLGGGLLPSEARGGNGPLVVFEGDSRTAQSINPTQGYTCYGYVGWVRALSKLHPRAAVLAVSGNRASDMQARKATVNDLRPWVVVRWCGVNDISASIPSATIAAQIIDCADSDIAGGAQYVVLILETGFVGWTATPVEGIRALNQALIDYARANSRVRIVHSLDLVVDYTAAAQVPIPYLAGTFGDAAVHPSVSLSYKLGARVAALLDSLAGVTADEQPFLMPGDTQNLLANPHFGVAGGGFGAGWSGAVPLNWYGYRDANANVAAAVQANATKPNLREVQMTITTTGAATVAIWQDPIAGIVAGDNIVASAEVEIQAPTALIHANFNLYSVVGGVTTFRWPLFYAVGYDPTPPSSAWPQSAVTLLSPETPILNVPSGAIANMRAQLFMQFSGAGGATVRLRKPLVKRVPSDYLS